MHVDVGGGNLYARRNLYGNGYANSNTTLDTDVQCWMCMCRRATYLQLVLQYDYASVLFSGNSNVIPPGLLPNYLGIYAQSVCALTHANM